MKQVTKQVVRKRPVQYARCGMGALLLLLFTACGGVTQAPALETLASTDGLVLEAESFFANTPQGAHSWTQKSDALYALPDRGTNRNVDFVAKSPRLDYKVNIAQGGTHYVWVRGKAAGSSRGSSDSVHVGLNGQAVKSADRVAGFGTSFGWKKSTMDGPRAKLDLPAGEHTLNVWMREDGFAFDKLVLTRSANTTPEKVVAASTPDPIQLSGGRAEFRAEAFHAHRAAGAHTWKTKNGLMHALPDSGANRDADFTAKSPRLDYRVNFTEPGTYYVWVRGKAAGSSRGSSDSVHVGLNGQAVKSADRMAGFGTSLDWVSNTMDSAAAKLDVTKAGVHTLNVWMREDGFAFDKLALSNSRSYVPDNANDVASGPTLLLPGSGGTGSASNASSLTDVQAEPAAAFIDTIGVNTHFHYQGTVYDKRYHDLIKPKLLELGVKHVRDGAYTYEGASRDTFFYRRLRELGAAGIHFNLITSLETPYNEATDYSKLDDVVRWTDGAVVAFEGINEPDLQGIEGWDGLTRDAQKKLYKTVRGNAALKDVKVLGPSPIWKKKTLGNLSAYMDYGNAHPYPGGKMPTGSEYGQSTTSTMKRATSNSGNKPIMFTETGYHNALQTDNDHAPTSEAASAKYLPRMLLEHFNMGVPRTYLYELIDSKSKGRTTNQEASFGLLRHDGTEKPAFRAIENLTGLLSDTDASFSPDTLSFALSGNTDDVRQTLLQKRDGTFYLALWVEKESWDRDARRDVQVAKQDVTVILGSAKNATLHTLDGSGRMNERALNSGKTFDLKVGDSVTVLELR